MGGQPDGEVQAVKRGEKYSGDRLEVPPKRERLDPDPCRDCSFLRTSKPMTQKMARELIGGVMMDCFTVCGLRTDERSGVNNFFDQEWSPVECSGASIFFANICKRSRFPDRGERLPKDTARVFASKAEYLAHHQRRVPLRVFLVLVHEGEVDLNGPPF